MQIDIKKLPKNEIEISIEVPVEEYKADLEKAAKHLSEHRPIPGFRPGKASYDMVKNSFGEMAIYEEALPDVVRRAYVKAVVDGKYRSYGEPTINVTKLAPGNPIAFTATVALVPEVSSLADFRKIKVKAKTPEVPEKDIDQAVGDLRKVQTKEIRVNREARGGDKIVVDMNLSLDKVPLEGGQTKGHGIYLDEEYYIPGFKEQVLGLKEGDRKAFSLKFPHTHYQKNVAGKDVDFEVTVKEIFELIHPDVDEVFAKSLGQESVAKLRELIKSNMHHESEHKEMQRAEIEMLEKLVEKSRFGEIPDRIVNTEIERMLAELKEGLAERGVEFETYLTNIKKTLGDLKLEFAPQAVKRIKTALIIRDIGEKEKIEVADSEILEEVQNLINQYKENAEAQARIRSEEYHDYLRTTLRNRKVIEMLRKEVIEKE